MAVVILYEVEGWVFFFSFHCFLSLTALITPALLTLEESACFILFLHISFLTPNNYGQR